jgi:hypothetical protein
MDRKATKFFRERLKKVLRFRETLTPETDRGCALMAAAHLDNELETLLRAAWVADDKCLDETLGQSKPLGTFASRIDVAYLAGLIGDRARRDLHLIRRIRNDFGHNPEPITFETESIARRCSELHHTYRKPDDGPRLLFTSTVLGVLAAIHVATHQVKRPAPAWEPPMDDESKREHRGSLEDTMASIEKFLAQDE